MNRRELQQHVGRMLIGLLLLAKVIFFTTAGADEPMLAIRFTEGESAIYAVGEIARIGFNGEETLMVVTGSGTDGYATETISRIEFLWEFSSIEDPGDAAALLDAIHLFQNQPNPFSPETRIDFEMPQGGAVELGIYGPDGRLVRTLVTGEHAAGPHTVHWDGLDDAGHPAPGGVYFYSLRAPGIEESRQMILLP